VLRRCDNAAQRQGENNVAAWGGLPVKNAICGAVLAAALAFAGPAVVVKSEIAKWAGPIKASGVKIQ
jgi:hypothetical protein